MYSGRLELRLGEHERFIQELNGWSCREARLVSFVNPFSYRLIAQGSLIDDVDSWYVDGALLVRMSNLFRSSTRKIDRVSFDYSSVAHEVFDYAVRKNYKVAIIGGEAGEASAAAGFFCRRHRGLEIGFVRHGQSILDNVDILAQEIACAGCKVVLLGLGTPLQENVGNKLKESGMVAQLFTCGGFITQTAMGGDYYHPVVKKFGLRWLQRAMLHKHVRQRLIRMYPKFILFYLWSGFRALKN